MAGFTRIQTPDRNLQLIQDNISTALNPLQAIPMAGGNMLTGIVLTSGNNNINHKLSHTPQFWILANTNAAVNLYQVSANSTVLVLNASAAVTISLWVN